jgi:hypothetical protein
MIIKTKIRIIIIAILSVMTEITAYYVILDLRMKFILYLFSLTCLCNTINNGNQVQGSYRNYCSINDNSNSDDDNEVR